MSLNARVKICGITSVEQALSVAQAGADAIGIVFYAPSPRAVMDLNLASQIANSVGPFVSVVALFVNASAELIHSTLQHVPIQCLQFHGDESPEFCGSFCRPYIKAVRMKPGLDLQQVITRYHRAQGLLLDTYIKGVPGGTGEVFNWDLFPKNSSLPIILAGGLTDQNVNLAVHTTQPYAVDVSGGVESSPGIKDIHKVRAFINNAKLEY